MRTRPLCLLFFATPILFAVASCSDDLSPAAESQAKTPIDVASLQGEELEKYAYGCEYYVEDTTEKVETSASEAYSAYVAELAAKSLEAVGNKYFMGIGSRRMKNGLERRGTFVIRTGA